MTTQERRMLSTILYVEFLDRIICNPVRKHADWILVRHILFDGHILKGVSSSYGPHGSIGEQGGHIQACGHHYWRCHYAMDSMGTVCVRGGP